ncbi:hypothetical protein TRFO_26574 [Tritrichomonas foetus]|uniref:Uncharacterized protein n=1 Tax=Tritrichomonas foetus TaxID=1144522 RepID=A0A1J4K3S5_9EUKA|nr:hypothetical protein TRFO_26574 [Tritrichomonas foetus]|eukprot:OHT05626.1 hypothetical protein TRFO_26574 [Tritrichomonas foetus]
MSQRKRQKKEEEKVLDPDPDIKQVLEQLFNEISAPDSKASGSHIPMDRINEITSVNSQSTETLLKLLKKFSIE